MLLEGRMDHQRDDWALCHLGIELTFDARQPPPRYALGGSVTFETPTLTARRDLCTFGGYVSRFVCALDQVRARRAGTASLLDTEMQLAFTVTTSAARYPQFLCATLWEDPLAGYLRLTPGEIVAPRGGAAPPHNAVAFLIQGMALDGQQIDDLHRCLRELLQSPGLSLETPWG